MLTRSTQTIEPSAKSVAEPDFRRSIEWVMLVRLVVTTLLLGATIFFHLSEMDITLIMLE